MNERIGNGDYIRCGNGSEHEFRMEMFGLICVDCGVQDMSMDFTPTPEGTTKEDG